jgi:thioredoxin 1
MIAPPLKEIDGALRGQVKVVKLNFNPGTAAKYDIMPIPTVGFFKNGELAWGQIGGAPKQKLEQWITALVSRPQEKSLLCDRGSST